MKVVQASGWFRGTPAQLQRDMIRWTRLAGIVCFTEVADPHRADVLDRAGFETHQGHGPGQGECAIMYHSKTWRALEKGFLDLLPQGAGKARLHNGITAPYVVLQHRKGKRQVIVSVAHLPAHIEGHLGKRTAAWVAWFAAVDAWVRQVKVLKKRYPNAEIVMLADWNLNAHRAVIRNLLKAHLKMRGLRLAFPSKGTHGKRTIDGAATTLYKHGSSVHDAEASDHDAVLLILRRRKRQPKHKK